MLKTIALAAALLAGCLDAGSAELEPDGQLAQDHADVTPDQSDVAGSDAPDARLFACDDVTTPTQPVPCLCASGEVCTTRSAGQFCRANGTCE